MGRLSARLDNYYPSTYAIFFSGSCDTGHISSYEEGEGVRHRFFGHKQKGHRFRWPFHFISLCKYGEDCPQLRALTAPRQNAGCSKWHPGKAAGSLATEAYPCGTLQGGGRLRTTLRGIFSIPAMCPFPKMQDISPAPSSAYRSSSPCLRV